VYFIIALIKYLTEKLKGRKIDFSSWFQRLQSILTGMCSRAASIMANKKQRRSATERSQGRI
jgi:hypothetical protein